MPTPLFCRALIPALIGALALSLSLAGLAEAKATKSLPASVRVVDSSGSILAQQVQYTTDARLRTDPKADCFGPDTQGSGQPVTLAGPTALGQVVYGSKITRSLRPVSVTDAFSFGLGICGIGKAVSPSTGFWYLIHDHAAAQVGAELLELGKNDSVLWYLIDDYTQPTPDELELKAAKKARDGQVAVTVSSYAADAAKSPAEGVSVSGASEPTDAAGKTTVELGKGKVTTIQATRDGSIPSQTVKVCAVAAQQCPYGFAELIGGTSKADKIKGSAAAETIRSGAGKDKVRVPRGKFPVKVDCGPGKDVLTISKSRKAKIKSCEKVRRTK